MKFVHMLGGEKGVFCIVDFPENISWEEIKERLQSFLKSSWGEYSEVPIVLISEKKLRYTDLEAVNLVETGVLNWEAGGRELYILHIRETGNTI